MNIVVTGGKGFIGSSVCDRLLKADFNVISIDNRKRDNYCFLNSSIISKEVDVTRYDSLKEIISQADGIIHLAAVSRVIWGEIFPQECIDVNVKGTLNVVEAAKQSKRKPWIILGSSREVYGETDRNPVTEDYPLNPINTYGISKLAAECLVKQYALQNASKTIILRFSNVYGELSDILDRVTPKFILNALLDRPLNIHGGNQIMDFTHIVDTVDAIERAVHFISSISEDKFFDHFHILPGESNSLYDLIEHIKSNTSKKIRVEQGKRRDYDVEKFTGNPDKAKELLGFKCKIKYKEGIKKTINLFEKELQNNKPKVVQKFKEDSKCELL
ncbi:UDP-glucose 4-epimerase [subsurface metagenome]